MWPDIVKQSLQEKKKQGVDVNTFQIPQNLQQCKTVCTILICA